MQDRILPPQKWAEINPFSNREHAQQLSGALQFYLRKPLQNMNISAKIQNAASADDMPDSVLEVLKTFQETTFFDDAWQACFDVQDMRSYRRNGFTITDVADGLTFEKVPDGSSAKVSKMAGSKVTVTFDQYGGGLHWLRRLFDDEEYWNLERNAKAFRNKWYASKSAIAYALIDALGSGINVSWQDPINTNLANTDQAYVQQRDMETINAAVETIFEATKNKGYDINPGSTFVLLYPLALHTRIRLALGPVNQSVSGNINGTAFNIRPVLGLGLSASDKYYVCLPEEKNIWAERMDLTVYSEFDPMKRADLAVGWGRYGGAIGDSDQWARCATA